MVVIKPLEFGGNPDRAIPSEASSEERVTTIP